MAQFWSAVDRIGCCIGSRSDQLPRLALARLDTADDKATLTIERKYRQHLSKHVGKWLYFQAG